jgi:hypothetical protein
MFWEDLNYDIFRRGIPLFHSAPGLNLSGFTAMTPNKNHFPLPARTPAFVDRKIGAAELTISEATWDRWSSSLSDWGFDLREVRSVLSQIVG